MLTIRDVTREVRLDARHVPHTTEPGRPRHIIDLTTVLDRRDFGLVWSSLTQKIADPVSITLHIELVPASSPA